MPHRSLLLFIVLILASPPSIAESWWERGKELFKELTESKSDQAPATPATKVLESITVGDISAGLKDALRVGTSNVVDQLGQQGGFSLDELIHIPLPEEFVKVKSVLDKVGLGGSLTELEARLNAAAEAAVPGTQDLFLEAIDEMNLADAKNILDGPNDAATRYFQEKMSVPLAGKLEPVIDEALNDVGALQLYDDIMSDYKKVPFVPDIKANLTNHTIAKSLDGIFFYLAREEAAIRENPGKRTTELLRKVFR